MLFDFKHHSELNIKLAADNKNNIMSEKLDMKENILYGYT